MTKPSNTNRTWRSVLKSKVTKGKVVKSKFFKSKCPFEMCYSSGKGLYNCITFFWSFPYPSSFSNCIKLKVALEYWIDERNSCIYWSLCYIVLCIGYYTDQSDIAFYVHQFWLFTHGALEVECNKYSDFNINPYMLWGSNSFWQMKYV